MMNGQPNRVLLIDDEPSIRRALAPTLRELGFQVSEAASGEEALQLLRTEVYDAALLDVNMPGIGGLETLRRIRQLAMRLPVLMLTVRGDEEDKVSALDLGADDYVDVYKRQGFAGKALAIWAKRRTSAAMRNMTRPR